MLIYEVNISVGIERVQEFQNWLPGHVQKMLGFDGFHEAKILKNLEVSEAERQFVVHYYVQSQADLESYFERYAAAMRAEGQNKFGSQLRIHRRTLVEDAF